MQECSIQIQDLSKVYSSNQVRAVDSLNLDMFKGEILGILGPNGAGKTTLLRMLVGLLTPTSGTILYNGEKVKPRSKYLRKLIGYVPQELILWKRLTVYEHMRLIGSSYKIPEKELKNSIDSILSDLNILEKKKELVSKLSGGMKRRLNLALGLIHNPDVLFLDEVFIGLDPQSRIFLYDYLRKISSESNKTIIITSHLMEIVDTISDRVGIIDNGQILTLDTSENLKNTYGKGDILHVELNEEASKKLEHSLSEALPSDSTVNRKDRILEITTLNAIKKMPIILERIEEEQYSVEDIKLSKQSLETVFISLTGKSLRDE